MHKDQGLAAVGAVMSFGGLGAGVACCVLPLALASVGIGASGLAALGPLRIPLSAIALLAVAAGWYFYARRRRACTPGADCPPPARSTLPLLVAATIFVALSAVWPLIEKPLMALFE